MLPTTEYGIAYAVICLLVAGLSLWRSNLHARIVSLIFVLHWVAMRALTVIDKECAALWVAHDAAVIAALGAYGWQKSSRLAFACASVFFVVMLFDQWWLIFGGSFDANAAVAETGGYLCFLMIAGAAIGTSNSGGGVRDFRRVLWVPSLEGGRTISRHASLSGNNLASSQNSQEKGRGA